MVKRHKNPRELVKNLTKIWRKTEKTGEYRANYTIKVDRKKENMYSLFKKKISENILPNRSEAYENFKSRFFKH